MNTVKCKILIVLSLCFVFSCKSTKQDGIDKISFLVLGDSYSVGKSVDQQDSWPFQLVDSLKLDGFKVARPKVIAKTSWRSDELLQATQNRLKDDNVFDVVTVLVGVNDQYQKKSLTTYQENLNAIFREAIAHSKRGPKGVFAVNIPDYGSASFFIHRADGIASDIDDFNTVLKNVASEYQIPVYDVNSISKKAYTNKDLIALDELHPSAKQYTLWVRQLLPKVRLMLK